MNNRMINLDVSTGTYTTMGSTMYAGVSDANGMHFPSSALWPLRHIQAVTATTFFVASSTVAGVSTTVGTVLNGTTATMATFPTGGETILVDNSGLYTLTATTGVRVSLYTMAEIRSMLVSSSKLATFATLRRQQQDPPRGRRLLSFFGNIFGFGRKKKGGKKIVDSKGDEIEHDRPRIGKSGRFVTHGPEPIILTDSIHTDHERDAVRVPPTTDTLDPATRIHHSNNAEPAVAHGSGQSHNFHGDRSDLLQHDTVQDEHDRGGHDESSTQHDQGGGGPPPYPEDGHGISDGAGGISDHGVSPVYRGGAALGPEGDRGDTFQGRDREVHEQDDRSGGDGRESSVVHQERGDVNDDGYDGEEGERGGDEDGDASVSWEDIVVRGRDDSADVDTVITRGRRAGASGGAIQCSGVVPTSWWTTQYPGNFYSTCIFHHALYNTQCTQGG